jgi:hypothetical protein
MFRVGSVGCCLLSPDLTRMITKQRQRKFIDGVQLQSCMVAITMALPSYAILAATSISVVVLLLFNHVDVASACEL